MQRARPTSSGSSFQRFRRCVDTQQKPTERDHRGQGQHAEASRNRFTIAHEIGHFVIPHHRLLKTVCDEKKIDSFDAKLSRPEVEANEFASELLLPSIVLRKRFNLAEFSLPHVSEVAAEFGTTLTATIRAFLNLTDLPRAMVWSQDWQGRWCAKSDAFLFFIPLAELPADDSFAGRLFRAGAIHSEFAPIAADLWLDRKTADQVDVLLEHSIALSNYNAVLSLGIQKHSA